MLKCITPKRLILCLFCAAALMLSLSGCATGNADNAQALRPGPRHIVLVGSYDEIWQAIQKAMAAYPIAINNVDQGVIQTESINSNQIFSLPYTDNVRYRDYRYTLRVTVVRGKLDGQDSAEIFINKKATVKPDFFTTAQPIPTDGMEEGSILYRVEREMEIQRSLKKAFERGDASGDS